MNKYVRPRIKALQDSLLASYQGGVGLPNAMIGGERELVLHGLFQETLPPIYRFGQGAITELIEVFNSAMDIAYPKLGEYTTG